MSSETKNHLKSLEDRLDFLAKKHNSSVQDLIDKSESDPAPDDEAMEVLVLAAEIYSIKLLGSI